MYKMSSNKKYTKMLTQKDIVSFVWSSIKAVEIKEARSSEFQDPLKCILYVIKYCMWNERSNSWHTDNYHLMLQFSFSSVAHFTIFQLIVWVLAAATLLFWLSQTALIGVSSRRLFQLRRSGKPAAYCPTSAGCIKSDCSFRILWRTWDLFWLGPTPL